MPVFKDETRGTFYVKVYYTDYTGARKQKMKRGFKLQRDAKEWERAFLEKVQGTPTMTFYSLYELYMADISTRLKKSSIISKKTVFNNRILPYFKDKPINAITPADIRLWQNDLLSKDLSDAYLRRIHNTIVTFFNYAVKYYNLPKNPCAVAGPIGKNTRSMNFWTLEQYNHVLENVDDVRVRIQLQLLFYSGMRLGELMALTLSDIDFTENKISINKSLQQNTHIIGSTKTENSIRVITMPPAIMDELREYITMLYDPQPDDLVFPFSRSFITRGKNKAAELAGVPQIRIHDLRHSHVSLLIEMGFSPHLIAERIGDTVQMINNIYGHLYPTRHQEVADKLNAIISK